jgi:prepilin-type N-terminal cleavage/methylation domain-containing protein
MVVTRQQRVSRRGLTLLEVILAMAIFLMSAAAIGNLLFIGSQRALEAQLQAQGLERCQSKMSEVIIGSVPVTNSQTNQPFDDDSNWVWSMDSTAQDAANLYLVKITVSRQNTDAPVLEVSLSQMVFDPTMRGTNAPPNINANNPNANNNGTGSSN